MRHYLLPFPFFPMFTRKGNGLRMGFPISHLLKYRLGKFHVDHPLPSEVSLCSEHDPLVENLRHAVRLGNFSFLIADPIYVVSKPAAPSNLQPPLWTDQLRWLVIWSYGGACIHKRSCLTNRAVDQLCCQQSRPFLCLFLSFLSLDPP